MIKKVYLLNLYCENNEQVKEFENWLTNVLYKINYKTLDRDIILEYGSLYTLNDYRLSL